MKNKRDRLETTLSGSNPDRSPVALWRHFPVDDQTPEGLARGTIAFQNLYDFDFVKVTPASSFCLKDWGVDDEWRGANHGTRDYTKRVIHHPDDWTRLPVLNPHKGHLGNQLEALRMITSGLGPKVPVIQTIFSPLSQAKNLAGEETVLVHLRRHPEELRQGLKIILESTQRFIEATMDTGIAGLFYAIQFAQYGLLSKGEFLEFGRQNDLKILEMSRDYWLNVLHIHGEDVMFDEVTDYPVAVINWHDQETYPSLSKAQIKFPGVVCGGLKQWDTMVLGSPDDVIEEAHAAIHATDGKRFILGTGCVTPIIAPQGNLLAARQSIEP
jgi:uroporphyrinogen decarboxylase